MDFRPTRQQRRALERRLAKSRRRNPLVAGAVLSLGAALFSSADAASITVNTAADAVAVNGQCSLREAIQNANDNAATNADCGAGSGADTVTFNLPNPSTITLSGGQLTLTGSMTIQGPGASQITIDANNASRIFSTSSDPDAATTISGVTLTRGNSGSTDGGAILSASSLVLASVVISDSRALHGGAASISAGSLTITDSIITGSIGGGISGAGIGNVTITGSTLSNNGGSAALRLYHAGTVTIQDTTISGNAGIGALTAFVGTITIGRSKFSANGGGGLYILPRSAQSVSIQDSTISGNTGGTGGLVLYAIQSEANPMTVQRTTISGNTTGGVFVVGRAQLNVENSTITGNSVTGNLRGGGGIAAISVAGGTPDIVVRLSTIAGNSAETVGGNMEMRRANLTLENTIVGNGTSPADPDITISIGNTLTANYSLIQTPPRAIGANNITGQDPQLGPLENNGGPTLTMRPVDTSPVVNAGDPAFAAPPATDQRGVPRIGRSRVDMGAVELQTIPPRRRAVKP